MRIAVVGASHWHVGVYYLPILREHPVEIVGLADPEAGALERVDPAGELRHYTDWRELVEEQQPELVLAHAPHAEMTALAGELVRRGQAFHIEKPAGVEWRAVQAVAEEARERGVFNSVALVSRYLPAVEALQGLQAEGRLGRTVHYYYRLFSGAPGRYRDWGVPWMLDPQVAGGGPLFNFGPHAADLFLHLSGERVVEVNCRWSHRLHGERIEDVATLQMVGEAGALGVGEVGYLLPTFYERYFSLTTDTLHLGGDFTQGQIQMREGEPVPYAGPSEDDSYALYVADMLGRFAEGREARADLGDMAAALRVLNAARRSAEEGRPVEVE